MAHALASGSMHLLAVQAACKSRTRQSACMLVLSQALQYDANCLVGTGSIAARL